MSRVEKNQLSARRALRMSPLVWLLALGACTSVLGIEDLHEGPRDGETGGSDNTTSGKTNSAGKTNNPGGDGSGGTTGSGGKSNGGGGKTNNGGTGNVAADAGMGNVAADGGAPEGGVPNTSTVTGHLIDIWGTKLPNVPVQIGNTLANTDENGTFVIENVPETYDLSLDLEFDSLNAHRSLGWVYQGLTRRDPTLQVKWALEIHYGDVDFAAPGVKLDVDQKIELAIGGVNGNTDTDLGETGTNGQTCTWESDQTASNQTAHALYFQYDHESEVPTSYFGYNSSPVSLSEAEKPKVALSLTKGTIAAGNMQGTVTSGGGSDRSDQLWVHFTSGALMRLVNSTGTNNFSYLVPTLPKSSILFAASEGDPYFGAFGIIVADGLSAASKPALKIPTPVKLTAPADLIDKVTAKTLFSWGTVGNAGPYVVQFVNVDPTGPSQAIFVVTTKNQLTIPEVIGGGMSLKANNVINWRVATHGKYASVDAMAVPGGGLQPFEEYGIDIEGPPRDGGEFTMSSAREFTTAP